MFQKRSEKKNVNYVQVPAQMQHFWIWCRVVKDINHEQEKERAGLHVFEGNLF